MTWMFDGIKPNHYGVIVSDPPWRFRNFSAKGEKKNPVAHYSCMDLAGIKALPVRNLAAPNCALIMWATAPLLPRRPSKPRQHGALPTSPLDPGQNRHRPERSGHSAQAIAIGQPLSSGFSAPSASPRSRCAMSET